MPAQLSPGISRNGNDLARLAACAMLLLGVVLAGSPASAQSDSMNVAPWQAPPNRTGWNASTPSATRPRAYSTENVSYSAETVKTPPPVTQATPGPTLGYPSGIPEQSDGMPVEVAGDDCGACRGGCAGHCGVGCDSCGCDPCGCDPCGCQGDLGCLLRSLPLREQLYFRGEYLMWWTKSADLPPLATTSPAGTPQSQAGVLGVTGTSILFGGDGVDPGLRSGGRFALGYWLCPCQDVGIETVITSLGVGAVDFNANDTTEPILARPFLDATPGNATFGQQNSQIVAFRGVQTGSLNIRVNNQLDCLELLMRRSLIHQEGYRVDLLAGYRYSWLSENLAINDSTTIIGGGVLPDGTAIQVSDRFWTANVFNGAEFGIDSQSRYGRWTWEMLAKLALGATRSTVTINGSTVTTEPGVGSATSVGGFLASPTNMGRSQESNFTMIPELGCVLSYDLTCRLKATFGYTFMYWSRVARPGDQVDTTVNTSFLPNAGPGTGVPSPLPVHLFQTSDFWAQGVSFGLDYRF